MAPVGGSFIVTLGLAVIFGGLAPHYRQKSIWFGLGLGAAVAIYSGAIIFNPPPPTSVQIISLLAAVTVELGAFVLLMPNLYRAGGRAVVGGTLAIVGGHFALMLPAFGPLIVILAALCLTNAAALWRLPRYSLNSAWLLDGVCKLAIGILMLS